MKKNVDGWGVNKSFLWTLEKSTLLARGRQVSLHLFAPQIKSSVSKKLFHLMVIKFISNPFPFLQPPPLPTPNHFFILCFLAHNSISINWPKTTRWLMRWKWTMVMALEEWLLQQSTWLWKEEILKPWALITRTLYNISWKQHCMHTLV